MIAIRSVLAAVPLLVGVGSHASADPLVIAPMIDGLAICQDAADNQAILSGREAASYCFQRGQTPASRIESILESMGPAKSPSGHYALGYTMSFPLLRSFKRDGERLIIDRDRIRYEVRTISEVNRPVVAYLFSNHFGGPGDGSDLDADLASDPANLLVSQKGPMPPDTYFEATVYPWNFANPNAEINILRRKAAIAVLEEICRLPEADQRKVIGVNLLGEVHHIFPRFFDGMGFNQPFIITDYSEASIRGFRAFLKGKFQTIRALNTAVGTQSASFDEVTPPSKDIRTERLSDFSEHLDRNAHGIVPIFGWARDRSSGEVQIAIYLDGALQGTVPANLNRLDVFQAKPEIGTPNVGWRYDLDFSVLAPGRHRLDVFANRGDGRLVRLTRRELVVMDRHQSPPQLIPSHPLSAAEEYADGGSLMAWVDGPPDQLPLFYNPLAKLWLEFRNEQVAGYIASFADIVDHSCLGRGVVFSHQIAPQFNASWDKNLFAVDQSLQPNSSYHLGVNLYGGATYGSYFRDWIAKSGHAIYAVPEFHPMIELPEEALRRMFEQHRNNGARYIAPYYVSITPERMRATSDHNKFRIDPTNPDYGSASLFKAIQSLLRD